MQRWEYQTLTFDMSAGAEDVTARLSNYGITGWELVATRPVVTSVGGDWKWLAILKRPAIAISQDKRGTR